jgi:hypothetical protein
MRDACFCAISTLILSPYILKFRKLKEKYKWNKKTILTPSMQFHQLSMQSFQ